MFGAEFSNEILDIFLQFVKAFAVGGGICLIAQIIINFTDLTAGKILVYFMLAGVVLTAVGLYQPLVDFAGAGATVPISGFGYLLANGAMRGAEKGFFAAVTGSLSAASAGVTAAVVFAFLMALIFKSRTKRN
ncbi:MAG: SpoVA/SpoVAEb family sporulation membrane protein [Clostridia bacterium]|nr:SpoVA/SpoVAEb family sporulation membrane protein [Clostridia bacterium]